MRYLYFIIVAFFLSLTTSVIRAQSNITTLGTDFWVTFLYTSDTATGPQTYCIFATSTRQCTAQVSNPNTGWSQSFTINPTGTNRLFIPTSQAHTSVSGQLANTGFHVTASDTISLYAITQGNPNLEYTNIIPTHVLRSDYMVQSYPADRYSSEFVIVAAENNVTVTIQQRGNSSDGHTTGDIYNITIPQAGQVYQLLSTIPGDLSGTRITAQNNKKIAVFNGDQCIYVPNQPTGRSCDHVVEQAMPVDYWGRRFIAVASRSARVDYVRVTALNNNCAITVNGNLVATIGGGDTYEYRMSSTTSIDDIRTSQPAMAYIYFPSLDAQGDGDPSMTTIVPIEQRLQHMNFPIISSRNVHSHYANIICKTTSVNSMLLDGNPVGTLFTPIANAPDFSYLRQSLSVGSHSITNLDTSGYIAYIYGFGPRVSYGYSMGYACRTLQIPQSSLIVNGEYAVDHQDGFSICLGDTVYTEIQYPDTLTNCTWYFGDSQTAIGNPAAHLYSAPGTYTICATITAPWPNDSSLTYYDTLCSFIHVNPTWFGHIYDTCTYAELPQRVCGRIYNQNVDADTIRLSTRAGCDSTIVYHLKVLYNDVTLLVDGQEAESHPNGFNICLGDTIHLAIFCQDTLSRVDWQFGDSSTYTGNPTTHIYSTPGIYNVCATISAPWPDGADILYQDTLCSVIHINPTWFGYIYDTCVQPQLPRIIGNRSYTRDTESDTIQLSTSVGCDSTIIYNLKVWYNDTSLFDTAICDSLLPYRWHGVLFNKGKTIIKHYTNSHGTDSLVYLNLATYPCPRPFIPPNSVNIWVPNIFTPDRTDNNLFRIFCSDAVTEASVIIYHRWGLFVTSFNGLTESWNGSYKGIPCPQGTYVYKISYKIKGAKSQRHPIVGTVTLLR